MATRSFIAMKTCTDFNGVYCHWDGYLEHAGRILRQHYTDPAKVVELIEHGDISSLQAEIGSPHGPEWDYPRGSLPEATTFYGRDYGRNDWGRPTSEITLEGIMDHANQRGCEYFYLFAGGQWSYAERVAQYVGLSDGSPFSDLGPLPPRIGDAA